MIKLIEESHRKLQSLPEIVQDKAWFELGGPAVDALETACHKFAGITGLSFLNSFAVITSTFLERNNMKVALDSRFRPYMNNLYEVLFAWLHVSSAPLEYGIIEIIAGIERGLMNGDDGLVRHFLDKIINLPLENSVYEVTVIHRTCNCMIKVLNETHI